MKTQIEISVRPGGMIELINNSMYEALGLSNKSAKCVAIKYLAVAPEKYVLTFDVGKDEDEDDGRTDATT